MRRIFGDILLIFLRRSFQILMMPLPRPWTNFVTGFRETHDRNA